MIKSFKNTKKKLNIYFPSVINIFTKNIKNNLELNEKLKLFSNQTYLKKIKKSIVNNRPDILHNLKLSNDLKKEIIKNNIKKNNLKLKYNLNKNYTFIKANTINNKSLKYKQNGGNKISNPLMLWTISKGYEIDNNGIIIENKNKNYKIIKEAENLIDNLSIKTIPTALWLIGNKLSINENGVIKKKKYNKLIQSGGSSLFYEINKLAVPILLWFVGYGLEKINNYSKTSTLNNSKIDININEKNLNKSIKKRMTRTIGGAIPFFQPIAETILIPGLFTLFGILLKKNIDSHMNKISNNSNDNNLEQVKKNDENPVDLPDELPDENSDEPPDENSDEIPNEPPNENPDETPNENSDENLYKN